MKEKKLFVLETANKGSNVWSWKVESFEEGLKKALELWNYLTRAEKETQTVELVEGYSEEDNEQELDLSAYDPIWSGSEMYIVDAGYNPNGGPYVGFSTLEEAERESDKSASYSQRDMVIYAPEGVYTRRWWNTTQGLEDCNDPIKFGNFGFYGDWELQEYSGATFGSYADLIKRFWV